MVNAASQELLELFDLAAASPPAFYRSLQEVEEHGGAQPYTHLIRRAWDVMQLNGVYCVDRVPTVYFKEVRRIDPEQIRELQCTLWNQGTATVLVVVSDTQVNVYSAQVFPRASTNAPATDESLVVCLDRVALHLQEFLVSVHQGVFYDRHPDKFNAEHAVDRYLLKNLASLRDELRAHEPDSDVVALHALLGRIIFTCYLTDREIISGSYFENAGVKNARSLREFLAHGTPEQAARALNNLFRHLQKTFNGSLFSDIPEKANTLTPRSMEILRRFLAGENLGSGQQMLSFWAYDFRVIPVELISSIYENFLQFEDEEGKRAAGAYYTPKHLAEMVVDVAVDGWDSLLDKRFLDPACGSGMFLVVLFNRIAEEWRRKNSKRQKKTRAEALIRILRTRLCGVDIKETACRITCFSLYLALLDQLEPWDVDDLKEKGKILPNLLALQENGWESEDSSTIFEGNFFDNRLPITEPFDLVLGNPPWVGRGKTLDPVAKEWCTHYFRQMDCADSLYAKPLEKLAFPNKQFAHAFMWKAPVHITATGRCCLLLPSKVLLNEHTNVFQQTWFASHSVEYILQLADFSFMLFEKAQCPAIVVRFSSAPPAGLHPNIVYDVPKVTKGDPRRGIIQIREADRKWIRLAELLAASEKGQAPALWKQALWGTARDKVLLEKLGSLPMLKECLNRGWINGQGFKPFHQNSYARNPKTYGPPKPIWWPSDSLYIDANNKRPSFVLIKKECEIVDKNISSLHRSPAKKKVFSPPMVLVNQGFSRFLYCDFPVLFQHAIQSISGPPEDASLLRFLAAALNSSLAPYYMFHTSANWGTERDKVHFAELLRFPFPLPDQTDDPVSAKRILGKTSDIIQRIQKEREKAVDDALAIVGVDYFDKAKREIDLLVYEYYGITEAERILIEDTVNIFEPSSTPTPKKLDIPTLRCPDEDEMIRYTETLCGTLNQWASGGPYSLSATVHKASRIGISVLTLNKTKGPKPCEITEAQDNLRSTLRRLQNILHERKGTIDVWRDLVVFDGDKIHLVKPLILRDWTRTAALCDADDIAAAILSPGRDT